MGHATDMIYIFCDIVSFPKVRVIFKKGLTSLIILEVQFHLEIEMFYLGDCLEGMKELDDRSIDAVVTSPPYNLNINIASIKIRNQENSILNG